MSTARPACATGPWRPRWTKDVCIFLEWWFLGQSSKCHTFWYNSELDKIEEWDVEGRKSREFDVPAQQMPLFFRFPGFTLLSLKGREGNSVMGCLDFKTSPSTFRLGTHFTEQAIYNFSASGEWAVLENKWAENDGCSLLQFRVNLVELRLIPSRSIRVHGLIWMQVECVAENGDVWVSVNEKEVRCWTMGDAWVSFELGKLFPRIKFDPGSALCREIPRAGKGRDVSTVRFLWDNFEERPFAFECGSNGSHRWLGAYPEQPGKPVPWELEIPRLMMGWPENLEFCSELGNAPKLPIPPWDVMWFDFGDRIQSRTITCATLCQDSEEDGSSVAKTKEWIFWEVPVARADDSLRNLAVWNLVRRTKSGVQSEIVFSFDKEILTLALGFLHWRETSFYNVCRQGDEIPVSGDQRRN